MAQFFFLRNFEWDDKMFFFFFGSSSPRTELNFVLKIYRAFLDQLNFQTIVSNNVPALNFGRHGDILLQ